MSTTQTTLGQNKLLDRFHELMQEYKGSTRYYNTIRGFEMIGAKLEDEGFNSDLVDNAIDEYGNQWWLKH